MSLTPADRLLVPSGSPLESVVGYSRAVRVGDRVEVAGTTAWYDDGRVPQDAAAQARRCLEIVETALGSAGASLADVVRTRIYLTDIADFPAVGEVHGEVFGAIRPACTAVGVTALVDPRLKVEIEAHAVVTSDGPAPGGPSR
jgi:enamine deaminase RidA (YjgF/YER057c/UK114 family)